MDVTGWDEDGVEYAKETISGYNRGGCYYDMNGNFPTEDLYERAEKIYQERHPK